MGYKVNKPPTTPKPDITPPAQGAPYAYGVIVIDNGLFRHDEAVRMLRDGCTSAYAGGWNCARSAQGRCRH